MMPDFFFLLSFFCHYLDPYGGSSTKIGELARMPWSTAILTGLSYTHSSYTQQTVTCPK